MSLLSGSPKLIMRYETPAIKELFHVKHDNELEQKAMARAKQGEPSNTAALSVECLVADLGLDREDAEYLVSLGVGCSSADDALSVLGHALTAATERAKGLEEEVEQLLLALEKAQAALGYGDDDYDYDEEAGDD